jgi:ABC-type multidrug transport system ATPase subunit
LAGERVLVLGGARALFEAAAGLRSIARGELRVAGMAPRAAVRAGLVASAPLDPRMPPKWTVRQYATWSARLAGHARAGSEALAAEALARMDLSAWAKAELTSVGPVVRRATVLAAALATGASILLVEDPLVALPVEAGREYARVVVRALADRRTAFFAARLQLESPIALAADEAIVLAGSHISAQGAPAEIAANERAFALRVGGDVQAFADAVQARGARLLSPPGTSTPARLSVDLGTLAARDLLRIAAECDAVVIELRPLAHAFA